MVLHPGKQPLSSEFTSHLWSFREVSDGRVTSQGFLTCKNEPCKNKPKKELWVPFGLSNRCCDQWRIFSIGGSFSRIIRVKNVCRRKCASRLTLWETTPPDLALKPCPPSTQRFPCTAGSLSPQVPPLETKGVWTLVSIFLLRQGSPLPGSKA